jgi:hypothetical protein
VWQELAMNLRLGFRIALLFALAVCAQLATAAELALSHATLDRLTALPRGEASTIDAFPVGPTHTASIRFERVQIYSDDAHLYVMTADGQKEVPRSNRIFLRGYSDDGSARVAMSLNPDASFAEGNGSGPEGSFVLRASLDASGAKRLIAQSLESTLPAGFKFNFRCGNENENMDVNALDDFAKRLGIKSGASTVSTAATTSHALRLATVAVDTDSLFMLRLFNNSQSAATNWIASMFNVMNTMYERDLLVQLYVGTTFYQTSATDPYISFTPGASPAELDFFSNYWEVHHPNGSPNRAFAILLSGQQPSTSNSCSAEGIAWVDQYCQAGFAASGGHTVGSYSVNQVCTSTNAAFGPPFSALLVGHEVGHNFGAHHTQCTNASTGFAPTGTTTIDQCLSGEIDGVTACYSGPTSCPSSGPGAPAGTIMSYCNSVAPSGCGPSGQNVLQFHPAQATVLDGYISGQSACLNETADIFYNGFE